MNDSNVRLSIITAVYNNATFIGECIENVLSQSYEFVEHIIVDGGSTDGTREIIERYAQQHQHICWLSEEDKGQSHAINKGLQLAKGSVVSLLNVDDYYEPDVFCKIVSMLENAPKPSILVGNCNVWGENGRHLYVNRPDKLNLEDLLLGFHINPFPINPSAYFYHASLHEFIGPYDTDEQYVLDVDFLFRAVNTANVKYIDEVLGNYRMLPGTKTVESFRDGQNLGGVERLIKKYRRQLPVVKRLNLAFQYNLFQLIKRTRGWFSRNVYTYRAPSRKA